MSFATDTAVERMGPGFYRAWLHERWSSLLGIHGGYTAAVVARAIEAAVADPSRPLRTIAVQFAVSPRPGPVEIEVVIERSGRSMTTSSARLRQGDDVVLVAHAVSASPRPGLIYDEHLRPCDADPGSAPAFVPNPPVGHFANVEVRLDPEIAIFSGRNEAVMAAWLRPLDGEPIDTAWVVAMCEVLPPAVFSRTTGPVNAASLEFVVHLGTGTLRVDPNAYVYLSCRSPFAAEGFAVEDGIMWGPDGTVLALSRQTRLAGNP
jgi:acyl-CoA thioesterase